MKPNLHSGPPMASLFHEGEIIAQKKVGVYEQVSMSAQQFIRPFMPDQHREFFAQLPYIVLAARDAEGRPWASLLCGSPGFIESPDDKTLVINSNLAAGDALSNALQPTTPIGLLGIMLEKRRRNRMNGRVQAGVTGSLSIGVDQSFGNCPQYISTRQWIAAPQAASPSAPRRSQQLDPAMQQLIASADTLFLASGQHTEKPATANGMDASHRGGPAGFVRILNPRQLQIPDYAGNNLFNTIGNLICDPAIGLLFIDFATGAMLQITGRAKIDWDSPALADYPGAQRLVDIDIEALIYLEKALPYRWSDAKANTRELRLLSKKAESAKVTSLYFAARDGRALMPFAAGQHLPVEIQLGNGKSVARSYSLSGTPEDSRYRISVKREPGGVASKHLHDHLQVGDTILAGLPAGDFVLKEHSGPVVLISAGVGVTPMVSLLHALSRTQRQVRFIHGARNSLHHLLAAEVTSLVSHRKRMTQHIAYSQPLATDLADRHFDHEGRISTALLGKVLLPTDIKADFYLCGPPAMVAALTPWLVAQGADASRIYSESF